MDTPRSLTSRRDFLKASLAIPAAFSFGSLAAPRNAVAETAAAGNSSPIPMRRLGRNGPQVTMLCMGGMMGALSLDYIDIAWSMGIRYFDTADCYRRGESERTFAQWLAKYPERRKDIFLVSKDHPEQDPEQLLEMIDRRLEACGTKYLDAFYIHGIGPRHYGIASLEWPKSNHYKKVAEQLRKSGKVKMVGFSCHDGRLVDYLNAAAKGGFVDIIMLKYTPFFKKGDAFDMALDACHKAGIGLVAMKTMRNTGDVPKRLPEFDKLGLTTHQAILQAVWSDSRIAAICNMIDNIEMMEAGTSAARSYKSPLKMAQLNLLKQTVLASRRTMCPGCESCTAFEATTGLAFQDIARYVTYYEQDGNLEARDYYHELPAENRDASKADLVALREACAFKTDYPEIIRRAERYFA
jgi:hypothetical protein